MASKPANNTTTSNASTEIKVGFGTVPGFTPPAKPARTGGGAASKYGFDKIGVGEFFSVVGKTRRQMASPINNAHRKYRTELTDAAGKTTTKQEREFYAVDVDADTAKKLKGSEHEGATTLVVRSK